MKSRALREHENEADRHLQLSAPDVSPQLFNAMFHSPSIGVAILDRRGRYEAVNESLASINSLPSRAHIGKSLHQVLGDAASQPEMLLEKTLTGRTVSQFHMVARLPARTEIGHWMLTYQPIGDASRKRTSVCAHVVEITEEVKAQYAIERLIQRLQHAKSSIAENRDPSRSPGNRDSFGMCSQPDSLDLFEGCLTQAQLVSRILRGHIATANRVAGKRPSASSASRRPPMPGDAELLAPPYAQAPGESAALPLTVREEDVIRLVLCGKTNKEAAAAIGISARTVEAHRAKIMLKLRVRSLAELMLYAVRHHLVTP
ncbi:MAG TPA: LuxR C-terminal-related transcriptional regulator [Candidatus Saccharimonadales bacterium]|nr:LuxR C-terminal-related transcriptional regulator [Candidatus Saccharimonadales bacterium]